MNKLTALLSLLQDIAICSCLLLQFALFFWAINQSEPQPPIPPSNSAERDASDEDADALPFGPAPRDVD